MAYWSHAQYDLRLTSEQFYDLTPRQFHALSLRHREAGERVELLMGINTSVLANHSMNTPKKAYMPMDFMPSKWREREEKKPKKRFNRQRFAESIRAKFKAMAAVPGSNIIFVDSAVNEKAGMSSPQ